MTTPYLKIYYRKKATFLTPEQIEAIRKLKDKVPIYTVIRDFHINENRVKDIWNNCERLQQNGATTSIIFNQTLQNTYHPIPQKEQNLDTLSSTDVVISYNIDVSSVPPNILPKKISRKKKFSIDNTESAQTLSDTSRRKADLKKLMKDTERLAPICPSLPQ
ncbi:hypothetical protein C2G38_2206874 [Gigaspora rosea]|uniref:Uncharacterized protein n=1 Tax=Gigaspora rosea TaxID=44941 RepID=A0A397ULN9_9GLOM|nr:hypothetical protein C2G38_2206874 [Gigaspora rosea]